MARKLAYLSSEYPGISHTFIHREIGVLRERGVEVHTASIRYPAHLGVMTRAEKKEAEQTLYIKDGGVKQALRAQWELLRTSSWAWLRLLVAGLSAGWEGTRCPMKGLYYFAEAVVLLCWMKKHGMTHVHVHFANPAATVAMIAAESGQIEYSISVHGPDIFYNIDQNLLPKKVEKARFIRSISHYCSSQLKRIVEREHWDKISIHRCGVDGDAFAPRPVPEEQPAHIVCVGRLVPAKGQHILVDALAKLKEQNVEFRASFVGGGPDKPSLEKAVERYGLSDQVIFTGAVGQDRVRELYRSAHLFVLPSFAEGVPVVLMEAMAMEIPCVSTQITGIGELIRTGTSGILVSPSDVEALAEAMLKLIQHPDRAAKMGAAGRRAVLRHYDLDKNAGALADHFEELLGAEETR
ncbi:glycosyltransferase family 4 protein [Desulfobaculum bizertense]|uniref:Glycosyltransferase involved in cell wall bisynthesis n=1 Tax=Desulfobaculum bizertense DSM 18034 TaxID=1121442 RepID=A0A1T4WPJ9_9BACT|nr:glycosyltransferase family 4 protein [Desulfobaculum bizertense]SKA79037.1 Glycosyltransferase involved in cell wall bisynthesis [Desulfobaculum bizertense DSM 18034]